MAFAVSRRAVRPVEVRIVTTHDPSPIHPGYEVEVSATMFRMDLPRLERHPTDEADAIHMANHNHGEVELRGVIQRATRFTAMERKSLVGHLRAAFAAWRAQRAA